MDLYAAFGTSTNCTGSQINPRALLPVKQEKFDNECRRRMASHASRREAHKTSPVPLNTKNLQRMLLAAMQLFGVVVSFCLLAFGLATNTFAQSAAPNISAG